MRSIKKYYQLSPPSSYTHCPLSPPTSIILVHNCKKKKKSLYCVNLYSFCLGPTEINQGHLGDYEFGALCWNLEGSAVILLQSIHGQCWRHKEPFPFLDWSNMRSMQVSTATINY